MNGYRGARAAEGGRAPGDIPVIMISALDEIDSVIRCIEAGAEDYLPKPFNPVLLRARINACLERSAGATARSAISGAATQSRRRRSEALLLQHPARADRRAAQRRRDDDRRPLSTTSTILFADLVGFTTASARLSPARLVDQLEPHLLRVRPARPSQLGLEKIKTIGDAYMVGRRPARAAPRPRRAIADLRLAMLDILLAHRRRRLGDAVADPHRHPHRPGGRRHHRHAQVHLRRLGRHREYGKPHGIARHQQRDQRIGRDLSAVAREVHISSLAASST